MFFRRRFLILAFYFTSLAGAFPLCAACLHVISIGDLAAKDLRAAIQLDAQKIESYAQIVAGYTGMELHYTTFFSGKRLPQQILKHLAELEANEDDVILFYYSGHGYRTVTKENDWPNLYFTEAGAGIDIDLITSLLQSKKAHLSIILVDCCNTALADFLAPPLVKSAAPYRDAFLEQGYRKLFVETDGLIMITSSQARQNAYSIGGFGSFYTDAFLEAFDTLIPTTSIEELSWPVLLEYSTYVLFGYTEKWNVIQDPLFFVDLD